MDDVPTLVVGIDPGTGVSSGTGLSVFNADNKEILLIEEIMAGNKRDKAEHRIRHIAGIIEGAILDLEKSAPNAQVVVCIEEFVMRGKGGLLLQRLVGALISRIPYRYRVVHVQNTRVKSVITGHGHADKKTVALGVESWFSDNADSKTRVTKLIKERQYDVLDSLAIGIAGYELEVV